VTEAPVVRSTGRTARRGSLVTRLSAVAGVIAALSWTATAAATPAGPPRGLIPVAIDDTATVVHGRTRNVAAPGVMGNDLQIGSGFAAKLVSGPNHGSLDLDANGGYQYTADMEHTGTDQFRYRLDGGLLGLSNVATVRITVTNTVPVARSDAYDAIADIEISVGVPGLLANDTDADGDDLTVDITAEPPHGNLNERDDGSFRYRADDDFAGVDTFRYRVWDGAAWSATATVEVTVTPEAGNPTPTPTAPPTPTGTPAPTATPPAATRSPSPAATARPSATPAASSTASPRPGTTATPSDRPAGSAPIDPSERPVSSSTTSASPDGGAVVPPPPGPNDPGTGGGAAASPRPEPNEPFVVPESTGAEFALGAGFVAFGGFDWAVPALVLTVPGLLLMIAIATQAAIGLAWLPVVRRWLGGDRRRGMRRAVSRER
jgi:hypothetical protein